MSEPDFVNEEGVKWWKDDSLTQYAHDQLNNKHAVYRILKPTGQETYVLIDGIGVLEEDSSYEGMCFRIDKQRLIGDF